MGRCGMQEGSDAEKESGANFGIKPVFPLIPHILALWSWEGAVSASQLWVQKHRFCEMCNLMIRWDLFDPLAPEPP